MVYLGHKSFENLKIAVTKEPLLQYLNFNKILNKAKKTITQQRKNYVLSSGQFNNFDPIYWVRNSTLLPSSIKLAS